MASVAMDASREFAERLAAEALESPEDFARRFIDKMSEGQPEANEENRLEILRQIRDAPWVLLTKRFLPYMGDVRIMVPRYTCAVEGCRLRLNRAHHPQPDGSTVYRWEHGRPVPAGPHKPIPVLQEELPARLICDFCSELDPPWLLACAEDPSEVLSVSVRSQMKCWAACETCKAYFDAGDAAAVTQRALENISVHERMLKAPALAAAFMAENSLLHQEFLDQRLPHLDRIMSDRERGLALSDSELDHLKR